MFKIVLQSKLQFVKTQFLGGGNARLSPLCGPPGEDVVAYTMEVFPALGEHRRDLTEAISGGDLPALHWLRPCCGVREIGKQSFCEVIMLPKEKAEYKRERTSCTVGQRLAVRCYTS